MRAARKLALRSETLGELATDDLQLVNGGDAETIVFCKISPIINPCVTRYDPVCGRLSLVMQCLTPTCP